MKRARAFCCLAVTSVLVIGGLFAPAKAFAEGTQSHIEVSSILASEFPDNYGGSWLEGGVPMMRWVGRVPARAKKLVATSVPRITLVPGGLSLAKAEELQYRATARFHKMSPGTLNASAYRSSSQALVFRGAFSENRRRKAGLPPLDLKSMEAQVRAQVAVDRRIALKFEDEEKSEVVAATPTGGSALYSEAGAFRCTSSWVAKDAASPALGIISAWHCGPTLRHMNAPNIVLQKRFAHWGQWGDWQVMQSPVMFTAKYQWDTNQFRSVTGLVTSDYTGEMLCKFGYGATPRYRCQPVLESSVCVWVSGVLTCSLVMTGEMLRGGDSGGPAWFQNAPNWAYAINEAYGITFTGVYVSSYFSKAHLALSIANWKLCRDTPPYPDCS